MKQVVFLLYFLSILTAACAQKDTIIRKKADLSHSIPISGTQNAQLDSQHATFIIDSSHYSDSISVSIKDSLQKDSINKAFSKVLIVQHPDTSSYAAIIFNPYFPFEKVSVMMIEQKRISISDDILFYVMMCLIFIIGFVRTTFPKYFSSLFELFFQTSFRQNQTRDQLLQGKLPSLMMNIVFVFSGGMFITLISKIQGWILIDFWWLYLYSCLLLAIIYVSKYLFLLFFGWIFNASTAANTYLFVIFLINKILAVLFLPLLLILAFAANHIVQVSLLISEILIVILLLYRYVTSIGAIRKRLHVNALHFFLYICAAEVLPLLLIYKVLFNYIQRV